MTYWRFLYYIEISFNLQEIFCCKPLVLMPIQYIVINYVKYSFLWEAFMPRILRLIIYCRAKKGIPKTLIKALLDIVNFRTLPFILLYIYNIYIFLNFTSVNWSMAAIQNRENKNEAIFCPQTSLPLHLF